MADDAKTVPVTRIILDIFILLIVGFPVLYLFLFGSAFHRGFYCDDESIRHPYKDSTVPSYLLYILGLGLNMVAMSSLEFYQRDRGAKVKIANCQVPTWLWQFYKSLLVFCFGALCSQLITDSMKYSVGRLRPHFYTICAPTFADGKTCDDVPANFHSYITDFECTNELSRRKLKEMRLSFPSGHSSFSMYTMLYFAIFLQSRMKMDNYKLAKHFLQYAAVLSAILTGMSRVSDYKHHWSDVLAGLSIGAICAIVTSKFVSDLFNKKREKKVEKIEPNYNGSNVVV